MPFAFREDNFFCRFYATTFRRDYDSAAVSLSLSPAILSPQVTSSEAMRMLASQENASDSELLVVADTMLELSTEVIAHKPPQQQLPIPFLSELRAS